MEKYLQLFIDEANEYLQMMNKSMQELEKEPNNESNLFQLYRCAHSIKGMAATMGYKGITEVAHSIEDVFDMLNKKKIKFTKELAAILYEGIDNLKAAIDNIKNKNELFFPEYLRSIKAFLQGKEFTVEKGDGRKTEIVSQLPPDKTDEEFHDYLIEVVISSEARFPAARAMVIHNKLNSLGRIKKFDPPLEEIAKGRPCYVINAEFSADLEKEEIESSLREISEVQNINIAEVKMQMAKAKTDLPCSIDVYSVGATFKIDAQLLDSIYNIITELFILNEEFQEYKEQLTAELIKISTDYNFLIRKLYDDVSKIRLLPLGTIMNTLPKLVREIAKEQSKKVKFITRGDEILVDKGILEHLIDPFVHLVRNAVDHGIENAEERLKCNKKEEGVISVEANSERGYLKIVFTDDGRGINLDKIKEVAIKKGFISEQRIIQMMDEEILSLITLPGFSTAPTVSEISGRGFGMDIVKARIESIGGRMKIESKISKGTKIILYVPLEISIVDSFVVRVNNSYFSIPMSYILKTIIIEKGNIQHLQSEAFVIMDSKKVSLSFLSSLLGLREDSNNKRSYYALITEVGNVMRGILVDEIIEQKKLIIKSLKSPLEILPYYQGIAVLSQGKLMPVIDINKLISY